MVTDSTLIIRVLPDTLRIVNLSHSPAIPTEYLALLGVILGASVSIVGNFLLAKRQARIQIQNTFFSRRLDVFMKLAEISWEGYSVRVKSDPGEPEGVYPQAYDTFQHLRDWLNSMVEITDRNRLLLHQSTYTAFDGLNHKILMDLDQIRSLSQKDAQHTIDWHTRNIGRTSRDQIQHLSQDFFKTIRNYIFKAYGLYSHSVK